MTGVMLLLCVLSAAGEYSMLSIEYDTMADCEAARQSMTQALVDPAAGLSNRPSFLAAACVVPVKLRFV